MFWMYHLYKKHTVYLLFHYITCRIFYKKHIIVFFYFIISRYFNEALNVSLLILLSG
jgi:hypothetical protein